MENDQIEELAVNIIESEILKYKDLKSNITKGDKEISWDGYITIFDGRGRGKNNFKFKIDVQVKGRKVSKIRKGNNKFALEKAHLENYQKQKNGTLLFVVDIIDNLNYQIYYANLLPVDLKQLIESNTSKAKKPKISIPLRPIRESSPSSLKNICRNFALNSKRQMGIPIKDLSELKNIETIEFKVISEKGKLFDYILNNDVYTYAILNDEFKTMIALPKGDLVMVQEKIEKNVQINNKIYYTSYLLTRQKDSETITIGKGIVFDLKNSKINFNFQGTLQERITDMQFFVDLIQNRSITINGVTLDLPEYKMNKDETTKIVEEFTKKINDLKILRNKFLELNIDFKEDIDKLDKQDSKNLLLFKKIFCDNIVPQNLKIRQTGVHFIKIGNCSIAILVQKNKNDSLKIFNFFQELKDIITVVIVNKNEKPSIDKRTSPYFILNFKEILQFSNFNAEIVFNSLNVIQNLKDQSEHINRFMLELLKAYDQNIKRIDILDLAERINNLLIQNESSVTNDLNKFQIIKRKRTLNQDERNKLIDLRNNLEKADFFNQCGIAILLENKTDYDYYYNMLDEENKKLFDTFPIKTLLK